MDIIGLTQKETAVLREVLVDCFSTLRMEIRHTDNRGFRENLKGKEEIVKSFIQRLDAEVAQL